MNTYTILPASSIIIPTERQRTAFPENHIKDLAQSIDLDGLIHAPTITSEVELVAGFCRLHAIQLLNREYRYGVETIPAGHIPVIIISGRSEEELFRIELEENLRRKSLTPVEESRAIARLHRMLEAKAEGAWTKAETAVALSQIRGAPTSSASSAQQVEIAENLLIDSFAEDEDVQRAKSRSEAAKLAKKKLESMFSQGLGALTVLKQDDYKLLEGDLHEILPTLEEGSFAGIISDPPYGIDADDFGEQAYHSGHRYEDNIKTALTVASYIFDRGFSLCKPEAHLYMFCDIRVWPKLYELATGYGWQCYSTPLIWHKPNAGHAPQPGYFTRRYEAILFARKGQRKLVSSSSDIMSFATVSNKEHAAQKPVELIEHLMKLSFFPGETILDPTCGSGTIFPAAKRAGLRAVGVERDSASINISKKRIGEL